MTLVGKAGVALLAAVLLGGVSAWSAPETPHQAAIDQAVASGLQWLADSQHPDGSWQAEGDNFVAGAGFGAMTFMRQGYDEATPYNGRLVVADAIAFILSQQKPAGWMVLSDVEGSIFWGGDPPDLGHIHHSNYETSVAVIALTMTGNPDYDDEIAAACAWLDKNQWDEQYPNKVGDPESSVECRFLGGFGYQCMVLQDESGDARPDLSNTQFSILGLHAAGALAGDIAQDAITYMHNCQGVQRDTLVNLFHNDWESCALNVRWDPTGTRIAYSSNYEDTEAACSLYVQTMDVADLAVTDTGATSIPVARYSPAVDKIAFVGDMGTGQGRVYLVNRDGTGLAELPGLPAPVFAGWGLCWSPDGTKLAITACLDQEQVDEWNPDIYIYDLTTDTLGPGLGIAMCAWGLDWSPATTGLYADKLLYTSCTTSPPNVWMVDVNTGVTTNLTGGLPTDCQQGGRWSPDATKIAFAPFGLTSDWEGQIALMDPDGTNVETLTQGGGSDSSPIWSPDGTKFAFVRDIDYQTAVMTMNADGSAVNKAPQSEGISPIGDWYVDSGSTDWVLHMRGNEVHWLELQFPVRLAPCGWNPEWSPGGDRISFESVHNLLDPLDPNDSWCVWVADADGAAPPVNLSGEGPAEWPTWSPDGSKLAFAARFDLFGLPPDWPPGWDPWCDMSSIWVVDPDGVAPPHNLCAPHHGIFCADEPDWGVPPDGIGGTAQKIAYHALPADGPHGSSIRDDIWTASPDGSGHVNLTAGVPGSLHNSIPLWSPDSTRIAYRVEDDLDPGTLRLWLMDHEGAAKLELAVGLAYEGWDWPTWSPDGTKLEFVSDGAPCLVNADGLPPDPQAIPNGPSVEQVTDWPAATPYASDGSLLTASSCDFGGADPILFKVDGYLDGGYIYTPTGGEVGNFATGSMTAAAVWCLRLCGEPISDPWVQNGLDWLANNYTYDENPGGQGSNQHYYYLWSAARGFLGCDVTSLPGVSHLPVAPEDEPDFEPGWYYDFSQYLVEQQDGDGSWRGGSFVDTFFALLILLRYGINTPEGTDVSVPAGDITITFDEVTGEGLTTVIVQEELPAAPPADVLFPDGYWYEVATTAEIGGSLTIEVDYSDTGYPPVLGGRLSVLLWNASEWVDVTVRPVDTGSYTIRGQLIAGTQGEWFIALALDPPPVPNVKVMSEACTEGRPAGPSVFVADADFSNPVRLTLPTPGTAALPECVCGCGELAAVWSPDGTRVAMFRVETCELYIMDLTTLLQAPGQEPRPLTDEFGGPILGMMPAWSPSGDQIVYGSPNPELTALESINVVNADGTGARSLYTFPEPDPRAFEYPDWSPDGTRIVFGLDEVVRLEGHLYLLENLDDPGGATLHQLTTDDSFHHDAPHWSPDGTRVVFTRSPRGVGTSEGSDIWVIEVDTGVQTQITHTPHIEKMANGWCPYDGYVYFGEGWPTVVKCILPDGSGEEVVASDLYPITVVLERWSWAPTGVWIDGLNALPGEGVTAKMAIADAENLAGVQAKVRYTGLCNTLAMYSVEQADAILDWAMPSPAIGPDVASFLAYASNPETQALSGDGHLFDLNVTNSLAAQPGDLQLLTFDDLKLSDDWGDPVERISFAGGVHTIPFAYLQVSFVTGPVWADPNDPLSFPVSIIARDRTGELMPDCQASVELDAISTWMWPHLYLPIVTPSSAALVDGVWSGEVRVLEPGPNLQLLAHWEDIGGYSNSFQAIGKGDPSGDSRINIFDVVKIANMAIGRGEWEPWQWWAGDLNGDDLVNIFDVILCANAAMAAMETMGVGRAGAPPVVTPPSELVIVTTDVSASGGQVVLSVKVSDCAGLAGIQVELGYGGKKLAYAGVSGGELLAGARSWAVMDNDLGGTVKAIAYTSSAEVLLGGDGTILTFAFNQTGKGKAKVRLTSVELADVEGSEIPSQTSAGKGGGKGKAR